MTEFRAGEEGLAQRRPGRAGRLFLSVVRDELLRAPELLLRRRARVAELIGPYKLVGLVVRAGQEMLGHRLRLADDERGCREVERPGGSRGRRPLARAPRRDA